MDTHDGKGRVRPGAVGLITSFVVGGVSFVGSIITISTVVGEPYLRALLVIASISAAVALVISYGTYRVFAAFQMRNLRRRETALYSVLRSNSKLSQWLAENPTIKAETAYRTTMVITSLLDAYKQIMESRTRAKIRAVLKLVSNEGGEPLAYTMARDSAAQDIMGQWDRKHHEYQGAFAEADISAICSGAEFYVTDTNWTRRPTLKPVAAVRWFTDPSWGGQWRSLLAVPVRHSNQILGVLSLEASRPRAFGQAEVEVAQLLSDQIVSHLLLMQRGMEAAVDAQVQTKPVEQPNEPV